jgi:hypothetical protein
VTELPPSLQHFRHDLERAVRADVGRRRRRRAGGVAAVLALVLVVVNLLPSGRETPGVAPASAVERAEQALQPRDGRILHFHMVGRQFDKGYPDVTWEHEAWVVMGESRTRTVQTDPQGRVVESARSPEAESLWDPEGERIVETPVPKGEPEGAEDDQFRAQAIELLRSGKARVTERTDDTVLIEGKGGRQSFLVDADDYRPIELRTRGTTGGTVLRFEAYEWLPLDEELLTLQAQHPGAPVVRDPQAYRALSDRLFPNG